MTPLIHRLLLLLRTECVLRLRRASTGAMFLLLCVSAYLLMPDVHQGNAVFKVGEQRVLLTSAATSLATAMTGSLLLGLFGFYLVSNAIARDSRTGVGSLIASTPVGSGTYLVGKFLGNVVYLGIVSAGFMFACMGMHLLRGEGPLEPMTFVATFAVLFIPLVITVAGLALLFESLRFLSGRTGDVLYFFVWASLLSLPAVSLAEKKGLGVLMYLDVSGMGLALSEIMRIAGTTTVSIGLSPFNASLPPVLFPGITWTPEMIASRAVASLLVLPLIVLSYLGFRRFDPAVRRKAARKKGVFPERTRNLLQGKWLVPKRSWLSGPPTLLQAVGLDVQLSLTLQPFSGMALLLFAFAGLLAPQADLRAAWFPALFFVLVPLVAGISTRDRSAGMDGLIFSAPGLRRHFVAWKFLSALSLALLIALVPLGRTLVADPHASPGLLVGLCFLAAAATALGTVTGTAKTHIVGFLFFLYIAVSSRSEPGLDFAGWNGVATAGVLSAYAGISAGLIILAWGWEKMRRNRE